MMLNRQSLILLIGLIVALTACVKQDAPTDDLFPPRVGEFLRTQGPSHDLAANVELATYQGPDGTALLRVRLVGKNQVEHALSQLPPSATSVGRDPSLGQREGKSFSLGNQYHAAWGNGDWVVVLSASTEAARSAFLTAYGF